MASAILDAIFRVAHNPHEAMALAYACGAESNCQSIQNLAGAPAWGPWQIYLPLHPGVTPAQANDPAYAAQYMYQHRDVTGCTAQQGDLWNADPPTAALNAARCIEGATSAEPYSAAQQQNGVAWMTQAATFQTVPGAAAAPGATIGGNAGGKCTLGWTLPDGSCILPGGPGEGPVTPADAAVNALGMVQAALASHTFWIRALLTIGGLGAILMGIKGLAGIEAMPVPVPV